jgi:GntR family transcriptional regulator/MocR family aminotransferase
VARDAFPWDAWQAAVERAQGTNRDHLLSYPPPAGLPSLRTALSDHVARYRGVRCSPDQIVVVNGTQQGINLLAQMLLEPGDRVAVEDPGYPAARQTFEARGLAVTRVPVDSAGLIVEYLEAAGSQRMVHVTPSHQEPTGATLSLERRLALLDIARQTGCLLLEDDYDSEFRYEGKPVESLQGLDRFGGTIYAGTFSKSVLPGLRVGFLVVPQGLAQPVIAAKSLWDSGAPILEQAALAEFMASGEFERHIRRMRRLYRARRDALVAALSGAFGTKVRIGERHGGLNMLVELDVPLADVEVVARAGAAGVGLRSAANYYAKPPSKPTFLMGFGEVAPEQVMPAIAALASELGHGAAR